MKAYLIKQVGKRAWVHAFYVNAEEAIHHCMIHTKAHEGAETSWWILQTERQLAISQDVEPVG